MDKLKHWTGTDTDAFIHAIASDFIAQIETKLEDEGLTRRSFARLLHVSPGRVSQILNDPSSFNLRTIVNYARVLGMKASIVAYDDGDPNNDKGPISAEVFTTCWENSGRPQDLAMFSTGMPATGYDQQGWGIWEAPQDAIEHSDMISPSIFVWSRPQENRNVEILQQGGTA